jgi:hypothetical protein
VLSEAPKLPEIYHDSSRRRGYWCKNASGFFMRINIGSVRIELKLAGFSGKIPKGRFISPVDEAIDRIQMEHRVHVVHSLAGRAAGIHHVDGRKILVLNSGREGEPK